VTAKAPSEGVDALAVTVDDCRVMAILFGFYDVAEFQKFARHQQRKHINRQLGISKGRGQR